MERSLPSTAPEARYARAGEEGFSLRRFGLVAGLDIQESLRRPLFLLFAAIMALNGWWMSRGEWVFRSIDTSLGSPKSWVDSEFQTAYVYALISYFMVSFFVAVAAGTPLIRDAEQKVGELLHSTPLRPSEYVWGKFLAALTTSLAALLVLPVSTGLLSHLLPNPGTPDMYGPFRLMAYLRPTLVFLVPAVVFAAGVAFALGRWTGRPILVFLFPVSLFLLCQSFLWGTYPPRIPEGLSNVLRYVDPSGFRWLKETWLFTDRGIAFYNTRPMNVDAPFLWSRVGFVLAGLLLVDLSRRHFAGRLRRPARVKREETARVTAVAEARPLAALGMRSRLAGFFESTSAVARFELQELKAQPGLYIFIPFILLFLYVLYRDLYGAFDTALSPLLLTPGIAATRGMVFLTFALGLLLLFYTVESLERERTWDVAPLFYATPVPSGAVVAGKILANTVVLAVALLGAFGVAALSLQGEGRVPLEVRPFLVVWGLLLLPTMIVWMTFAAAVLALTRSRFGTYGVCLAAALVTSFLFTRNHMNWVGNWVLIGNTDQGTAMAWTDMGGFDVDQTALVLNRLFVLALSALFGWTGGRFLLRRDRDRLHPVLPPAERRRTWTAAGLLALPPLALGLTLWGQVNQGFQGAAVEKEHKDYWRKNLNTWMAEPLPYVTHVEMDLDLEPAARGFQVSGFYDLQNQKDKPLYWIPVTGGTAWKGLSWTLDGRPWTPEDRSHLYVFRLDRPLATGQSVRLGFKYRGTMLPGVSKNGGDLPLGEFILPSGVILTGRNPDFVPKIGFERRIGVDEKNRSEPRIYAPHFYDGRTDSDLDRSSFTQRLRISAPAEYTVNSTGILEAQTVRDGRRTTVWVSDYPVRVFNVAAGRWAVKRGPGTAVFYHPGHPFNVDTLLDALNGARRWYAAWYAPYPWRELRLNEFPAYSQYARGNATNIFFSEGVGFLTERQPGNDEAFAIAAHESAHQWWGHIVSPGEGPGGIILAEGAANFATLMLLEQVRGPQARQFYATNIEAFYGEYRMPSDEKPLAETLERDGRPGDIVVVYNKGAWAFWMLSRQMGRDAFLAGVQQFFRTYHDNPDHPVIQDFVAVMRPYAPDKQGFDDLARQVFFQIVTPEYRLEEARKQAGGTGGWEVTVKVENAGTGRFPVEVAATRGPRFDDDGKLSPEYRDARQTVVLGAGESKLVRIRCSFEPERVVVDPDAHVLQLQRKAAAAKL
ncbi:MAG TPA: M1 family aminopeptidase [Thermoanaerobaculia bacterium]|jgi:ABC-type transport system involved in multi-copper enzyme maturation permease subunit|nr:M1 family aminopeptidase [Thermoanaerobaculia bacterium]